jgi:hypothetical protein
MKKNWLDKILFSNTYQGDEECNVIIRIILRDKYLYANENIVIINVQINEKCELNF